MDLKFKRKGGPYSTRRKRALKLNRVRWVLIECNYLQILKLLDAIELRQILLDYTNLEKGLIKL